MIKKEKFGRIPADFKSEAGRDVEAYTLTNKSGASVKILDLGGIVAALNVPDRNGKLADCVCGFADVNGYLTGGGYHGSLVGRYANRIGKGRFTLNGREYPIAKNDNGKNHLHGGDIGYNIRLWNVEAVEGDPDKLILTLKSPDGEEGYPGNLDLKVTYTFGSDNALGIHYEAVCDADTICNLTNHTYFNLDGYGGRDILTHKLRLDADKVTEVDSELIPTGNIISVEASKFDFRTVRDIENPRRQLHTQAGRHGKTCRGTFLRRSGAQNQSSRMPASRYTTLG